MQNIKKFIEDLQREDPDIKLEIRIAPTEDGQYRARVVDPRDPNMDLLDRQGDMILSCTRTTPSVAVFALDALCGIK